MYGAEATKKDMSGVAIEALNTQSQTTSGVYFDNYYYAFQSLGEVIVSLEEQFLDQEQELRITGDQHKDEFIKINEQKDGKVQNSIQESKADFIISKQDYRETIRLQAMQMLSEIVLGLVKSGMGEMALKLLDLVFDGMDDLPHKDEIVARIRKANGQAAPDDESTPEEQKARQEKEQAMAQEQQTLKAIQLAMAQAQVVVAQADASSKESKALKDRVDAQMKKLEGFLKALEAAGAIKKSPEVVAAADELIAEAEKIGTEPPPQPAPGQGAQTD